MPRLYRLAAAAFSVLLLCSCERTVRPVQKGSEVPRQTESQAVLPASGQSDPDSLVSMLSDTLVVSDTAGADFTTEDLIAVKGVLNRRLHLDEFTTSGSATPYGKACRFYDTTFVRRYVPGDIRVAFVRPRLIKIAFIGDDHYVRTVSAAAEITRLALLQRGVDGKWYGPVTVTRDTLSLLVSSSVADSTWTVCERPAHFNGWNENGSDKPYAAWVPIRAVDIEQMPVTWDGQFTTAKLRQLADSISQLPPAFVVEGNPEPKMPIVYKDVCPGEGCEFGAWLTCDTLRVSTEASDNPKTTFVLRPGDRFTALTGDVHVRQAGKVVFRRNVKVDDEGMHFFFTPADTLYPLLYGGEGFGSWYFRGKESGGFFFFGNADQDATDIPVVGGVGGYEVIRPIQAEWWVKVRAKDGREGWLRPHGSIYGRSPHYEDPMPAACPGEKAG